MTKAEFLAALSVRLADISPEEHEEAVKYYTEYLDEVPPENVSAAIDELGGAEKVANIIRANCGKGPIAPEVLEEAQRRMDAQQAAAQAQAADTQQAASAAAEQPQNTTYQSAAYTQSTAGTQRTAYTQQSAPANGTAKILLILLLIFTCPVWIGIVFGLFGAVIGVFFGGVGTVIGGVVGFFTSISLFISGAVGNGLVLLGSSMVAFAIGIIMMIGMFYAVKYLIPVLVRVMQRFFKWFSGKVGNVQ